MSELNLYWAEDELGEPYAPQDYRWLKSTRRFGLLLGGATCVVTASALLGGGVFYLVDISPQVAVSSYEIEGSAQMFPQAPLALAPEKIPRAAAARTESTIQAHVSAKTPATHAAGAIARTASPAAATAPAEVRTTQTHVPAPTKARPGTITATEAKTPLAAQATETRKRASAPAPAHGQAKAPATALAQIIPAASAPPAAPAAKPEPGTTVGISKGTDSKPTDIASGEKLGIREILADGIVMHNGRKVKNGSALPNGELLMGTDAAKGMAETDRRVLVLTP